MRSGAVAVMQEFVQHATQLVLAEDEHLVGQLGAQDADPALRERIRTRAARRDLDHCDARCCQDADCASARRDIENWITDHDRRRLHSARLSASDRGASFLAAAHINKSRSKKRCRRPCGLHGRGRMSA